MVLYSVTCNTVKNSELYKYKYSLQVYVKKAVQWSMKNSISFTLTQNRPLLNVITTLISGTMIFIPKNVLYLSNAIQEFFIQAALKCSFPKFSFHQSPTHTPTYITNSIAMKWVDWLIWGNRV